jgi:hypothetical protein
MSQYIRSLISRWLLPSQKSVEERLAALREPDHNLERVMARRVYARLRKGHFTNQRPSDASTVL